MLRADNHSRFRLTAMHRMRTRMQIVRYALHAATYRREINLAGFVSFVFRQAARKSRIQFDARERVTKLSVQFLEILVLS